jgi:hypothetical protein
MEKKMKSAALTNSSGPGSSITLSPTSIRVRDAIIEKFIDKSLDELNSFLVSALDTERDEAKRIGILAARVYILRTRISKITEFNQNSMIPQVEAVTPHELVNTPQHFDEPIVDNEPLAEGADHLEEWNELLTIEDGEVNGVRIPRGVAITVGRNDAARLIETGKAELITEESSAENPVSEQDLMPNAPDMQDMDATTEAEPAEHIPEEQAEQMSTDEEQDASEFAVEDSGSSVTDTAIADDEEELQGPPPAENTQTPDVGEAETDETKSQK